MQTYPRGEWALVVDCTDLEVVADFWTRALDSERAGRIHEPCSSLLPTSGHGAELLLQRASEGKDGKNRLHLDLRTPDLAAEVQRLTGLGATVPTDTPMSEGGWLWHVLSDPERNESCVLQPRSTHSDSAR